MTPQEKFDALINRLGQMQRVIIAFSGGVDSTFLLKAAALAGLERVLAVTGQSESMPAEEFDFSCGFAASLGIEHRIIATRELDDRNYAKNPPDRCYYCKKELFTRLRAMAEEEGITAILDGTNADDAADWRPGIRAAREEGIHSPLLDAGLSKDEIRSLSRSLGLPTWNKPATPCLSSRFPYGQEITAASLSRVAMAEQYIRRFGIREFRVRCHGKLARIELLPADFSAFMDSVSRERIVHYFKSLGFRHITLDLQGFRSGSGNEGLTDTRNIRP